MKAALGKKWFLLTERSTYSKGFPFIPDRETRVYLETDEGWRLEVTGVVGSQSYTWDHLVSYDGVARPVSNCGAMDSVASHEISDRLVVGLFFKQGALAGQFSYEVLPDPNTGREMLRVITSGMSSRGNPYYKVLEYTSAKL